jgi:hypothetical protein
MRIINLDLTFARLTYLHGTNITVATIHNSPIIISPTARGNN